MLFGAHTGIGKRRTPEKRVKWHTEQRLREGTAMREYGAGEQARLEQMHRLRRSGRHGSRVGPREGRTRPARRAVAYMGDARRLFFRCLGASFFRQAKFP
jgi:hypothetical protein